MKNNIILIILGILATVATAMWLTEEYSKQQQSFQQQLSEVKQQVVIEKNNATKTAQENEEALQKVQQEATAAKNEAAAARQEVANTPKIETGSSLSSVIAKWHPLIARIGCSYLNGSVGWGSGTLIKFSDYSAIVTNRHVVDGATRCAAAFPGQKSPLYQWVYSEIKVSSDQSTDMATLEISSSDPRVIDTPYTPLCKTPVLIGMAMVILGYPVNGGTTDLTATEGIISSFEGDYYVSSAKINPGNSGGAAIDIKNECYLGIPTYTMVNYENLARILKWQAWY